MFVQDGFLYLIVTRHKLTVSTVDSSVNLLARSKSSPAVCMYTMDGTVNLLAHRANPLQFVQRITLYISSE
jgi:hypothetical protein